MATVSFEGETHDEIVGKVRAWLESVEAGQTNMAAMISQQATLTKDALRIIAESAPGPISDNDVVKSLTKMGYKATDATRDAALTALSSLESATGGSMVKNVADQGSKAMFKMNAAIAKQFLKAVTND
ncbi:MAG: hypothetical protein ACI88C_001370 [Acidimicrobiales bacterium]|jgi:hypothetical protein